MSSLKNLNLEHERRLAETKVRIKTVAHGCRHYLRPLGIDPSVFAECIIADIDKDPALVHENDYGLLRVTVEAARRGLVPDGESSVLSPLGRRIMLIPLIGGMYDIVRRNLPGIAVDVTMVRRWDEFRIATCENPAIFHRPQPPPAHTSVLDTSSIDGGYCVVKMGHAVESHYLSRTDIERIRKADPAGNSPRSPWRKNPIKMYEKAVMRDAFRKLANRYPDIASISNDIEDYCPESPIADRPPAAAIVAPAEMEI